MCSRTATGRCSTWSGRVRHSGGNRNPWLRHSRGRFSGGAQEFGVEYLRRHYLAAPNQPNLVRTIIRECAVQRAEMVPHQDIILAPDIGPTKPRLELMDEQVFEHLVAFALGQFIDPHDETGVATKDALASDRMRQEQRMDHRRAAPVLLIDHRWSHAVV